MVKSVRPSGTKSSGNASGQAPATRDTGTSGHGSENGGAGGGTFGKALDKLNGNQLVEAGKAFAGLVGSVMDYRSEAEKTEQARIAAQTNDLRLQAERENNFLKHEQAIKALDNQRDRNRNEHDEAMTALDKQARHEERTDDRLDRAMTLLESEKITAEDFVAIQREVNRTQGPSEGDA